MMSADRVSRVVFVSSGAKTSVVEGLRGSRAILVAAVLAVLACTSERTRSIDPGPSRVDAGHHDSGQVSCHEVDRACPAQRPLNGAPCAGALSCDYPEAAGMAIWTHRCEGEQWASSCATTVPGGCSRIPLSESCSSPAGQVAGARVEVGPASATDAFRPFEAGDTVVIEWGAQGLPMLPFRVRVTAPSEPGCVIVGAKMTLAGREGGNAMETVKLRCGESLKVLSIIPFDVYDTRIFEMDIAVTVPGAGTSSASVRFMGGPP